jgi:hypothetical protein
MEFRGRDLLSAEARFLADYCGEDAVRRWHARLSDAERNRLVPTLAFVQELCRAVAGAIRRALQAMFESISNVLRSSFESLFAAYAWITGRAPESFGHQAL